MEQKEPTENESGMDQARMNGWVQAIMKRKCRETSVECVVGVTEEQVVDPGENYTGTMTRLNIRALLGSGKLKKKSLIVKTVPESVKYEIKKSGLYRKEVKMYHEVLPLMRDLMEEFGDDSESLWAQCYDYEPYDRIVLEDLRGLGYKMLDRRKPVTREHASVVMKALGKFHAMSVVLKERDKLNTIDFKESIHTSGIEHVQSYHNVALITMAEAIKDNWGDEWSSYPNVLRNLVDTTIPKLAEDFKLDPKGFNVLNHGDCWRNNIMFKHINDEDVPTGVRFVDFQMCYYSTYIYDLQYFVTSSLTPQVRDDHLDTLLEDYRKSVVLWLSRMGRHTDDVPTPQKIREDFDKSLHLALIMAATNLTFMIPPKEQRPNFVQFVRQMPRKAVKLSTKTYSGPLYRQRAEYILKLCKDAGVI